MQVVIASYVYDNAALTDLLVRRLADRPAFALTVLVDKEKFQERESFRFTRSLVSGVQVARVVASPKIGEACLPKILLQRLR